MSELKTTDQMRRFLGQLGADPDEIEWEQYEDVEASVAIKRTLPMTTGIHGHCGSWALSMFEAFSFDPRDWCDKFFGGGTYRVRLRLPTGKWLKQGSVTIAGSPVPKAEGERRIAKHFGIETGPEEEDEEEPPRGVGTPTIHTVSGLPGGFTPLEGNRYRLPSGAVLRKGEVAEVVEMMQAAADNREDKMMEFLKKRDEEKKPAGGLGGLFDNPEVIAAIIAAFTRDSAETTLLMKALERTHEMSNETLTRSYEMMQASNLEAAKSNRSMTTETLKTFLGIIQDTNRAALAAKESGSFTDQLPELIERFLGPIAAGMTPQTPLPAGSLPPSLAAPAAPGGELPAPAGGETPSPGEAPPGSPEIELPGDTQQKAMAVGTIYQFLGNLKTCLVHQPDPEDAWDEMMAQSFGVLPGPIRIQIESLEDDEYDHVATIFSTVEGVNPMWLQDVVQTATTTEGGLKWLASFWDVAPWKTEELGDEELPEISDEEHAPTEDESAESGQGEAEPSDQVSETEGKSSSSPEPDPADG